MADDKTTTDKTAPATPAAKPSGAAGYIVLLSPWNGRKSGTVIKAAPEILDGVKKANVKTRVATDRDLAIANIVP